MKQRNAEILLIIVIASRSISYLLSKIGLNGIPPLELLAIRFALTTLILLLLFHRRLPLLTRQLWKAAGLLGTFLFACMACELISLTTIPSSTAAFLENTSAVWVLILMAVVSHHWPGKQVLTATSLLLIGIASSKFSARIGMPVLVLFLGVGMLAGSEGVGGIAFEDYRLANSIGSVALALIL